MSLDILSCTSELGPWPEPRETGRNETLGVRTYSHAVANKLYMGHGVVLEGTKYFHVTLPFLKIQERL